MFVFWLQLLFLFVFSAAGFLATNQNTVRENHIKSKPWGQNPKKHKKTTTKTKNIFRGLPATPHSPSPQKIVLFVLFVFTSCCCCCFLAPGLFFYGFHIVVCFLTRKSQTHLKKQINRKPGAEHQRQLEEVKNNLLVTRGRGELVVPERMFFVFVVFLCFLCVLAPVWMCFSVFVNVFLFFDKLVFFLGLGEAW